MPLTSEAQRRAQTPLQQSLHQGWALSFAAISDVGQRREANEDFYLLYPERSLFVLADGMGGHAAGEVAARMASETIAAYFDEEDLPRSHLHEHLRRAVQIANASVFDEAQDNPSLRGMGTTLVAMSFDNDRVYCAHVGDSRLYIYRDETLGVLTRDHSLLEDAIASQDLSHREAQDFRRAFPYRNVLTRAVGSRRDVDVDLAILDLKEGDIFLLTSDGVHDVIGPSLITEIIRSHRPDFASAAEAIVKETNSAGGPDNITALFVQVSRTR